MTSEYGYTYEKQLAKIMRHGVDRGDRTGTGTRSLFGLQMRFDLRRGFPLVTTKRVFTRPMVEELLWMLSGSTDNNVLRAKDVHIWDAWAREDGALGPIYGEQWRAWPNHEGGHIDQIAELVEGIRTNPDSRRHVVSAWNVADLPEMALAPCHCLFQFYVANGRLSCQLYQRSADMFLGVPFNIASYALLTHMVAQQCDLEVGEFIWTGGDCHVYSNHFGQVREQIGRKGFPLPTLNLQRAASIFDYRIGDVVFENYECCPAILAPVAV
ncbi:MAG: thymidylate synthase [Hydrogenophaga sp.]|nr:thymidylate synthase [Hydrogenophaga sp.]